MFSYKVTFEAVRELKELKEREWDILEWKACTIMPKPVALHCALKQQFKTDEEYVLERL